MGKHSGDTALVKKAARGDPKAFGALVRQEQEYLYRMAFRHTGSEEDALDVVQESILKAYKSLKTLRDPELFRTWLTRIVINTARALCRKRGRELPLEEERDLPAPETLPEEEKLDLYAALDRLPETYRNVVKLKYFEGLTIREIARELDMPEGTVSSLLSRVLKRLKGQLNERRE